MRRRVATLTIASTLAGGLMAGCIDLFHSTDFDSLCMVDATACTRADGSLLSDAGTDAPREDVMRADADASPLPPTDFCGWTRQTAHDNARHACAWLGACAGPFGNNVFGTCLDHALRTYDCTLNPNRKILGEAHAYWDCLWQATSCSDVTRCVFPRGVVPPCDVSSEFPACAAQDAHPENANTRIACAKQSVPVAFENCVGVGQTCSASQAECAGVESACTSSRCDGQHLRDCTDGGLDFGVDCALYGAGTCTFGDAGPACIATGGGACAKSSNIACDAGVATGCPSGVNEAIDCRNLMEDAGTCLETAPGRPWDVSRACVPNDDAGCGEACLPDGGLVACHRGKPVGIACNAFGLGECQMLSLLAKPAKPACKKP